MDARYDVLIVGGGQGGARVASALRQEDFAGSIAIVGDEPDPPYDRPPLSKEYLAGEKSFDQLLFRKRLEWEQLRVSLVLGERVIGIDPGAHAVTTATGGSVGYGRLVWAAGGTPRTLASPGHDLPGVHTIRNRADVDRIKVELPAVREVVVIGGGYIGLEAAAVLCKLGKRVTVVEALDRVLARVAGEPLSRFYEAEHRARGVDVRLGCAVERFLAAQGRVSGVRLAEGIELPAQLVLVGVGIAPNVAPLLEAGAAGGNGVRVDESCRTSLPDIFAIGDCAEHRNRHAGGEWIRLESVQNANDQGTVAAKAICGRPEPYSAVPWFWSNQYDLKLQTIGVSRGFDDCVLRGDPATRSFSLVYLREGRVIALDCVNCPRDYSHGRLLVSSQAPVERERLADHRLPLKSLLATVG